jgi:chitodextrinase
VLSINPETQNAEIGETFNVTIMITIPSGSAVDGVQFEVEWNSTVMNATAMVEELFHSVTPQSDWSNIWAIMLGYNNTVGYAEYAYTFMNSRSATAGGYAPIGPGTYAAAIITFMGISTGRSLVDFPSITIGSISGMSLPASSTQGSVTVGNVPPLIEILTPQNDGYSTIPVNLTLKISGSTSWIGYSIDNQANVTLTNMTLTSNLIQVSEGQHSLEVYANNTAGQMASSSIVTFIADSTAPTVNLAVSPSAPGAALKLFFGSYIWEFNFSAVGSHAHLSNISAYFWDFGDGTNATAATVTHEYFQPGTYNVTLEVTDLAGNTAEQTTSITISPAPGPLPPFGLVAAVVIPVVWAVALAFYVIRFRKKKRALKTRKV